MVREIITVNVGQCGIQFGETVWQQYCCEHDINKNGYLANPIDLRNKQSWYYPSFYSFFEEKKSKQYQARNIMIDLESSVINTISNSSYGCIFNNEYLLSANEPAMNFADAYHYYKDIATSKMELLNDKLRKLVDKCDNVHGFIINRAMNGSCGSGLGSVINERIGIDYRKKSHNEFTIYDDNITTEYQIYNAVLATYFSQDYSDQSFVFSNNKMHSLCRDYLGVNNVTYNDMNLLMAKIESAVTEVARFKSSHFSPKQEVYEQLLCVPKLKYIISSISPILNNTNQNKNYKINIPQKQSKFLVDAFVRCNYNYNEKQLLYADIMQTIYGSYTNTFKAYEKKCYSPYKLKDIFEMCVDPNFFSVECEDYNVSQDQYIAVNFKYHGFAKCRELNNAVCAVRENKKVQFVEWWPLGTRINMMDCSPKVTENDSMVGVKENCVCLANNVCISRFFRDQNHQMLEPFHKLYSKNKYVDDFVNFGMEKGEFDQAVEEFQLLLTDYWDVVHAIATDDDESDESD